MTNKFLPLALLVLCGCNLLTLPTGDRQADDSKDKEVPPVTYKEQDYYNEIATHVEMGIMDNSDVVVLTVERLKQRGLIQDVSRIQPIRAKRIDPIRDADKAAIVSALKGQ